MFTVFVKKSEKINYIQVTSELVSPFHISSFPADITIPHPPSPHLTFSDCNAWFSNVALTLCDVDDDDYILCYHDSVKNILSIHQMIIHTYTVIHSTCDHQPYIFTQHRTDNMPIYVHPHMR